jgi:hypothetical protein
VDASDGGGTDLNASEAGSDATSDGPVADASGLVPGTGTVNVTAISVNGVAKPDFTCVAKGAQFLYVAGGAGAISVGCNNGMQANNLIAVGFGAPAAVGTHTETTFGTGASLQSYTTILNSLSTVSPRTSPRHTIKLTEWDLATGHAVGTAEATWDMPAGAGNYGTYKLTFDLLLKK